ncbi:HNH endonuclease signature motif containing protein [Tenacibaculum maritimum]|uniref:HNH endonuclease signature motif containing protein n=1 Tax=Tenacibaculum maritimum TaxID=107401 RepID=UPI0004162B82|nr:HNH endonuclease [Tenacibaculum maritimum]
MAFTEEKIQEIWEKGTPIPKFDPNKFRKDQCDAWIFRDQYGNRDSIYGWEIDHITPLSNDGGNENSNLRPLQWQNNIAKSNGKLTCAIVSKGTKNIKK